jgi:hypothetical protein
MAVNLVGFMADYSGILVISKPVRSEQNQQGNTDEDDSHKSDQP